MSILKWFIGHFNFSRIFVLFSTSNIVYRKNGLISFSQTGYTDVYISMFRIMRIQRTVPWNKD